MLQTEFAYRLPIFQSSVTNAGTASGNVDRLGFDYVRISVLLPTADVVSNKPTVLKISESDDTVVTNFANVSGFVGGTDFTIPNAITSATSITQPYAIFNVDCRGRKRYLKISVSPATTQVVNAVAELGRARVTPLTTDQATVVVGG
jgi:uncharacterized protein (DUF1778 family)